MPISDVINTVQSRSMSDFLLEANDAVLAKQMAKLLLGKRRELRKAVTIVIDQHGSHERYFDKAELAAIELSAVRIRQRLIDEHAERREAILEWVAEHTDEAYDDVHATAES